MEHMKNDNDTPKFIGEIVRFISHFKGSEDTFLHGCCFWFAWILYQRFALDKSHVDFGDYIVYEPVEGHFLYAICDDLRYRYESYHLYYFDIRGDVSELYRDKETYKLSNLMYNEPNWYTHLMRDCRDFLPTDD